MKRSKRKPIRDERKEGYPMGEFFTKLLLRAKKRMLDTNDNFVMVCTGQTGSGKTSLSFMAGDIYSEGVGIDRTNLAMDKETFVRMLLKKKDAKGEFIIYDEGSDVNRRSSLSAWNRDFLDALLTLRGKNWFLWINLPDPNYLDRMLIESELINGFVFIHRKQKRFLFFTRGQMKQLFADHGNLKPDTIRDFGGDYMPLDSYWNKYTGSMWDEYQDIKDEHMDKRIDRLVQKYGKGDTINALQLSKHLGVAKNTMYTKLGELQKAGYLKDAKSLGNHWAFTPEHVELIENYWRGGFEKLGTMGNHDIESMREGVGDL